MAGHRRWIVLIVAAVVAVGALGVVATQLELSRAKERPCGTPLRIDLRASTRMLDRADELRLYVDQGDLPPEEAELADELEADGLALDARCKDRQRLALLGLGAGGTLAAAAVALSTYQLGRRRGRAER